MDQPAAALSIMAMADLATPMAIRVAATLCLVERAGPAGATAEQLAVETSTEPTALRCLLDHLVTVGVFDCESESGHYGPTDLGRQMSEEAPAGIKPLLDINRAGGRAELAFVDLLGTIVTGAPAYPRRYGQDFWADLDDHPHLRRSFDAQMTWRFQQQASQIAENIDWHRLPTSSTSAAATDWCWPRSCKSIQIFADDCWTWRRRPPLQPKDSPAGLADRAVAVAGSFFDSLPAGADVYLLSDILHDWDDDHARKILSGCRRAAAPNGAVLVTEPVLGQGTGTAMDLFMLMCFGGRERTVDQLVRLATDSGLTLRSSAPVAEGRTALEFAVIPDRRPSPADQREGSSNTIRAGRVFGPLSRWLLIARRLTRPTGMVDPPDDTNR